MLSQAYFFINIFSNINKFFYTILNNKLYNRNKSALCSYIFILLLYCDYFFTARLWAYIYSGRRIAFRIIVCIILWFRISKRHLVRCDRPLPSCAYFNTAQQTVQESAIELVQWRRSVSRSDKNKYLSVINEL